MHISYQWLKDYIDIKASPEKLAELLTMSGTAVGSVTVKGGDHIMELEVTSNRPDCLSMVGIAREVAALTGKKLTIPKSQIREARRARPKGVPSNVEGQSKDHH
ncbi:MAG: hypothetical protein ABIJ27_00840 [Candidatus Omnitrophota bacterium]